MVFQFNNVDVLLNVLELYASYDIEVLLNVLNNSNQLLSLTKFPNYLAQLVAFMQNPQIGFSLGHLNGFVEWLQQANLPTVNNKMELIQELLDYTRSLRLRGMKSARNS